MSTHANMVRMTVTGTPGTGAITLNAMATGGLQTFLQAYGAVSTTVDINIEDPIGTPVAIEENAVYNGGSPGTITRGTPKTPGSLVSLTSAAVVSVVATAAFGNDVENALGAWGALSGENSITGTATALMGRLNVCSGTSADYTVTLPAVSGNAGRYIGFRMASGLTKLVTLDGNASETIDTALTRVMWAQETALLYCNGSTWTKMAGKSRPMIADIGLTSASATFARITELKVSIGTVIENNTGLMHDSGNARISIVRAGRYLVIPFIRLIVGADTAKVNCWARSAATSYMALGEASGLNTAAVAASASAVRELAASTYVELYLYHDCSATPLTAVGGGGQDGCHLAVIEQVSW